MNDTSQTAAAATLRDCGSPAGVCPYVNNNDPRCGTRFSLGRIEQAFSVCFGAYHGCPMYHRINNERFLGAVPSLLPVAVTISQTGKRHVSDLPLRPTGT